MYPVGDWRLSLNPDDDRSVVMRVYFHQTNREKPLEFQKRKLGSPLLFVSVWCGSSVCIRGQWHDLTDPVQILLPAHSYWPSDCSAVQHESGRETTSTVCSTCKQRNLTRMVFISSSGKISFKDVIVYNDSWNVTWMRRNEEAIYFDLFVGDRCNRFNRRKSVGNESWC